MKNLKISVCIFFCISVSTVWSQLLNSPKTNGGINSLPADIKDYIVVHYDGANRSAIGGSNSTYIAAVKFTSYELGSYIGSSLERVQIYIANAPVGNSVTIKIWGEGSSSSPGTLLLSQQAAVQYYSWNEITLNNFFTITANHIWIGYEATCQADPNQFVFGHDGGNNPDDIDGQYIYYNSAWTTLRGINDEWEYNWNIRAVLNTTPFVYPRQINLGYSKSFGDYTKPESYRMIGVPGTGQLELLSMVTGEYGKDWRAFYDNGASSNYLVEYNEDPGYFYYIPGEAFWIHAKNGISISGTVNTVTLSNDYTYSIYLNAGWTIISNPFGVNVSWIDVRTLNSVSENIYDFQGSYQTASVLTPYKGYYFYNATGLNQLKIPYNFTPGLLKEDDVKGEEISIEIYNGQEKLGEVNIGFSEDSKITYDPNDRFAPPGDFVSTELVIVNSKIEKEYKRLFKDYRGTIDDEQVYDLEIKTTPGKDLLLSFSGLDYFPGYKYCLIDTQLNKLYRVDNSDNLTLSFAHETNRFKFIIAKEGIIDEYEAMSNPAQFALLQNYPNPFNSSTVIRYNLSGEGHVILEIFDALGQKIKTVLNKFQQAGTYEVFFEANDLSSGVYLYRITAGNNIDSKKFVLTR